MTSTVVDSSVLIDVLDDRSPWNGWSSTALAKTVSEAFIINQIVYAEVAAYFDNEEKFEQAVLPLALKRESIPWEAARRAGMVQVAYRRRGGSRERVLADFLIGAHAASKGHRLLTRDARRYRTYFPELDIIAPDTHP